MEQFRKGFNDRIKPKVDYSDGMGKEKVDPFRDSQIALKQSMFAKAEREDFFKECYTDILTDLFMAWLKSPAHATKERDFLYASAMALGSVKAKMVGIEMYGTNMQFINQQNKVQEGTEDNE
jgi:hypothetical protein